MYNLVLVVVVGWCVVLDLLEEVHRQFLIVYNQPHATGHLCTEVDTHEEE
jgi:hypothetical protein